MSVTRLIRVQRKGLKGKKDVKGKERVILFREKRAVQAESGCPARSGLQPGPRAGAVAVLACLLAWLAALSVRGSARRRRRRTEMRGG